MNGFDLAARDLDLLAGIGVTEQQAADARRTIARFARDSNDFFDLTRARTRTRPRTGPEGDHMTPADTLPKWADRISIDAAGCWLWEGYVKPNGYASITITRLGTKYVHRLAYEAAFGEIPDGLEIDHLCRVRRCVNPEHLEAVTRAENTYRGHSICGIRHRQTHCGNGHEFTPENTWISKRGHRTCRACGAERKRAERAARRGAAA